MENFNKRDNISSANNTENSCIFAALPKMRSKKAKNDLTRQKRAARQRKRFY